jgi:hypothetical protein
MTTATLERRALGTNAIPQGKPGYVECALYGCKETFKEGTGFTYEHSGEYCNQDHFNLATED